MHGGALRVLLPLLLAPALVAGGGGLGMGKNHGCASTSCKDKHKKPPTVAGGGCAKVDLEGTKTKSWPDSGQEPVSYDEEPVDLAEQAYFHQISVEVGTWNPFEHVTLALPNKAPFTLNQVWGATLVAFEGVPVEHAGPGQVIDTTRVTTSVTFEIGCVPAKNEVCVRERVQGASVPDVSVVRGVSR